MSQAVRVFGVVHSFGDWSAARNAPQHDADGHGAGVSLE
jgi:hypothetical protein